MNPWHKPIAGLAFVLISVAIVAILPYVSAAAPQGASGTPLYLPVILKNAPLTPTPTRTSTATPTGTATATATTTLTPTPTETPITPTIPITVAPGGLHVFSPISITIHVNDMVRWTWAGTFHTVTSGTWPTADNQFCSPDNSNCSVANTSNAGATFDHQFTVPGTYEYFCQIHGGSGMTGTVVVIP